MFVIRYYEQRAVPLGTIAEGLVDVSDEVLTCLDIVGGMLVAGLEVEEVEPAGSTYE